MPNQQPTLSGPGSVFLEKIVLATRSRISRLKTDNSIDSLEVEAKTFVRRSMLAALTRNSPAIIAEVKKASPSRGILRSDFDPVALAVAYESGGAAALSIVTEPEFFRGDDVWIGRIRSTTTLPILRKDFVLDPIQVAESAALGADAILLIARLLSVEQMRELYHAASELGLDVLFEAHDEDELAEIGECKAQIVGVNARNLDTFVVDTSQFDRLRSSIPPGVISIAESGIESHSQIESAMTFGYSGFLIGESLVRSADPAALLQELRTGIVS